AGSPRSVQRSAIGQPKPEAAPGETLRTALDRPIDIRDIRLDLRVDLPKKAVDGRATLQVRSLRSITTITLDAVGFDVKEVGLSAGKEGPKPAHFAYAGKKLAIKIG